MNADARVDTDITALTKQYGDKPHENNATSSHPSPAITSRLYAGHNYNENVGRARHDTDTDTDTDPRYRPQGRPIKGTGAQ